MRTITSVHTATTAHWVGNGFPVSSQFSYQRDGAERISPFLLLDYAGPVQFGPAQIARGVGSHPHRGFETVTLVYQGELEHKDNAGHGGTIGAGEVQWMTAGAGIVHEEFHSANFAKTGGTLEMVQLWVNLPAQHKATPPAYQSLTKAELPWHALNSGRSTLRVVAGSYPNATGTLIVGPAATHSDLLVADIGLAAGESHTLRLAKTWNLMITVLQGTVLVNGSEIARDATTLTFAQNHEQVLLEANNNARLLITAGAPLDEPVVGYGPFVMNTWQEIETAMKDFAAL